MSVVFVALLLTPLPGLGGDGLIKLQTADPPCPDDSANVYVDCDNGTVTDNRTGLVWLKEASCFEAMDWQQATMKITGFSDWSAEYQSYSGCNVNNCDCGLSDGSSPGEWRLPTFAEWEAMVADAKALGCTGASGPTITTDNGLYCWHETDELCVAAGTSCSFMGVLPVGYWSATADTTNPANAWDASLNLGTVFLSPKSTLNHVWPVRD